MAWTDFSPYTNEDGEVVRICCECYNERTLAEFIREDGEHQVCNWCSPPAEMPEDDAEYGSRLVQGHTMMGTEDDG